MEPYRYHVFVCDQQKPEGVPCCSARGSARTIEALRREIAARHLGDQVQITVCGSLGVCERGPNVVVYPEGVWYSSVQPADVPELVETHFQQGRVLERLVNSDAAALKAEITGNRDKMLAAMRAKDAAGILPDDLAQTLRAFQESRVLLTAVELDVFTAIGEGRSGVEVAGVLRTDPRATEMLLNALAAMGTLTKQDGVFHNTPLIARYFTAGAPDDSRAATMHTVHLWERWSTLTACVRAGTSVSYQEHAERREDWTEAFIAAMHRNAAERAPHVVAAVGTEGVARMLDVGGGSGAYSIAFAKASEKLRADLLDLPAVLPIAQRHIEKAALTDRITTRAGDLRTDKLGEGYNLVFVSAICHMLNPDENLDLMKRCYAALAPQGRLVIQDFILEPNKTAPKFAALFALNMLVGTQAGSSYSEPEYAAWLREAGFQEVRHIRLPGPSGLIVGTRG
ncbi:MAG: methyltransferase domain-containing protein [Acidobacteriia bacterium]|nr:methyltransferase domain-containing protein [Terriglobia bacterium]